MGSAEECTRQNHASVYLSRGYISPHTIQSTIIGSNSCPWLIRSPNGHNLNFTLYTWSEDTDSSACYEVAEFKEGNEKKNAIACGRNSPVKGAYVTKGDQVEVSFVDQGSLENVGHVLLYFQGLLLSIK